MASRFVAYDWSDEGGWVFGREEVDECRVLLCPHILDGCDHRLQAVIGVIVVNQMTGDVCLYGLSDTVYFYRNVCLTLATDSLEFVQTVVFICGNLIFFLGEDDIAGIV